MRITLSAGLRSDLNWDLSKEDVLWHLDFGSLFLYDQAAFYSYALAIEQFVKRVKKPKGVILYEGSAAVLENLEKANVFAEFLHRLASFLPDEIKPYCLFEQAFTPGKFAQLTSKDRFWHLHLSLEEKDHPLGLLLPQDEYCTEEVIQELDDILTKEQEVRIVPEVRLNEMWQELDELIVIQEAVSPIGKRHIQGFLAAGGKVRSRGIRTPDPLLPKQLR
jgi:hypothetical protein